MNKQEVFNAVFLGLKAQGFKQSLAADGIGCKYRGADGMKCAVGQIIPDELYKKTWDKKSLPVDILPKSLWKKLDIPWYSDDTLYGFMWNLQTIHDNAKTPELMESRYRDLASNYDLTVPE